MFAKNSKILKRRQSVTYNSYISYQHQQYLDRISNFNLSDVNQKEPHVSNNMKPQSPILKPPVISSQKSRTRMLPTKSKYFSMLLIILLKNILGLLFLQFKEKFKPHFWYDQNPKYAS